MTHVLLVGALPESLVNFRGDLISDLVRRGFKVTAMAAPASEATVRAVTALGATFRPYRVRRAGRNPVDDVRSYAALARAIRELQPDIVVAYTIKPVILCGLALTGVPRSRYVPMVTGLGYAFRGTGLVARLLRPLVIQLYRLALRRAQVVIFQNSDDRRTFAEHRIGDDRHAIVVRGSGVNTTRFARQPLPGGSPTFLLIARLLAAKGIREYVQAAQLVRRAHPEARFQLIGPSDASPDRIDLAEFAPAIADATLEYLGEVADVRPYLAACHVFVLPSHHEGLPRTVLEAMSVGRPILTTDAPGCRETVVAGTNGLTVSVGAPTALADAMTWFLAHRDAWDGMASASRAMAERDFDVTAINRQIVASLREAQ